MPCETAVVCYFCEKTYCVELANFIGQTSLEWILLGVFFFSFLVQLFYLLFFYRKLLKSKPPEKNETPEDVALLLCVRNEEDRIRQVLENLNTLSAVSYEIIAVDDFSEDRTLQIIGSMAEKYPRIRITSLPQETRFSEKMSINLGLKASRSSWAMVVPVSTEKMDEKSLTVFNQFVSEEVDAVIGYSNFKPAKGKANRMARIERFVNFMQSAYCSLGGMPLVFSETNVCFNKQVYFKNEGFKGLLNRHHANLELIFNDHLKKTAISFEPETFIREDETVHRQDYINLIRKTLLLRLSLGFKRRAILFFEEFSRFLLFLSFVVLMVVKPTVWVYAPALFVVLNIFFFIIVKKIADRLNEEKIFISSFMYMLAKPLINIYHVSIMYIQDRRSRWN